MKRNDYIFTIGFDGNKAIVDRQVRARYGRLDARALADKGMFQAAYRCAVFEDDTEAARYVLEKFNEGSSIKYKDTGELFKVFGVQRPSGSIIGIRAV
ncbi:MAG: hypothetical protein B0D92_06935 [Spirochaeta sp. LUC14_002_19_P3]|nr:MAG: hypothetical protein B0D92_06935 [Spirochaeta sp. LUC14_002_19_P3]